MHHWLWDLDGPQGHSCQLQNNQKTTGGKSMGDKKSQDFFVVNFLGIFLLDGFSIFFNSGEGKLPEVFQAVHVNSAIRPAIDIVHGGAWINTLR